MPSEYDFTGGVRGKYAASYAKGSNVVVLSPDVAKVFPDSESANRALRAFIEMLEKLERIPAKGNRENHMLSTIAAFRPTRDGYDPTYGARPLKRLIQQEIENPLARRILAGEFSPGDHVSVEVRGDFFGFEKGASEARQSAATVEC